MDADMVLIDERLGRRVARLLGFQVKGTLGILLAAVLGGLLAKEDAMQDVMMLTERGFRIAPHWVQWFHSQIE